MNVLSKEYFEYLKKAYIKIDKDRYYERFLLVDIKKGFCILDIGCGLGFLSQKIRNMIDDDSPVIGIDVNLYALDYARKIVPSAYFIRASADKLPFSSEKFNVVFALDLIEHLKNPVKFLEEVQRVLFDTASFILCTPDRYTIYLGGKNILKHIVSHVMRLLGFRKVDPTHIKEFTIRELSKLLTLNSLVIIRCNGYKTRFVPFHRMGSIIVCCKKRLNVLSA